MALTPHQEKFAQLIVSGNGQSDAYKEAYPASKNWKDATVHRQAFAACRHPKILARINELKKERLEAMQWDAYKSVQHRYAALKFAHQQEDGALILRVTESFDKFAGLDQPDKLDITTAGAPLHPPVMVQYVSTPPEDE